MQVIKTGLLCSPAYDEDATTAVRRLLETIAPAAVIVADRSVSAQRYLVEEVLRQWCDEDELDLVLTLGGTLPAPGPSPREIMPEATAAVVERLMPGLPEAMRAYASEETALAMLDRGLAGIRGRTLILNLPAGADAAVLFLEALADILAAIVAYLQEDPVAPTIGDGLRDPQIGNPREEAQPPGAAPLSAPDLSERSAKTLNADEFAAYLRRKSSSAKSDRD